MVEANNTNVKFELLWKGSRDGYQAETFHTKCDNQGPTLTVIKSEHDKVFGGFTSVPWTSAGASINDPTAFIYSLTRMGKYAKQLNENSIDDYSYYGPIFGCGSGGCDIRIYDNCNTADNYCTANCTYQLPAGAGHDFLAGSGTYSVKEIEVYAVKNI